MRESRGDSAALAIQSGIVLLVGLMLLVWRGTFFFFVLGAVGVCGSIWRLRRPTRFVLVSNRWLRVFGREQDERRFDMARIKMGYWSRVTGEVIVPARDGTVVTSIPTRFLSSHRRAKQLAALITQYAQPD